MGTAATTYPSFYAHVLAGHVPVPTASWRVALVSSGYVFDATDRVWADVSAHEITGTGYTAGGRELGAPTVATDATGATWTAAPTTWPGATFTARWAVLYAVGTFGGDTNPLALAVLLDETPGDISVADTTFSIIWWPHVARLEG